MNASLVSWSSPTLAAGDEETNGRGVPVLEEVEVGAASVLHLVADSLTSRALEGGDDVRIAWSDSFLTEVLLDRGHVAVAGVLGHRLGQLSKVDLAVTAESESGSLEVLLLGEEEDEAASLIRVRLRDVEVVQGRLRRGDGAVVGGARGVVRRGRVNRDDQVRSLVRAVEVSRAALAGARAGGLSTRGRRRRRGLSAATGRARGRRGLLSAATSGAGGRRRRRGHGTTASRAGRRRARGARGLSTTTSRARRLRRLSTTARRAAHDRDSLAARRGRSGAWDTREAGGLSVADGSGHGGPDSDLALGRSGSRRDDGHGSLRTGRGRLAAHARSPAAR